MAYNDLFSFYRSSEWESFRDIYKAERMNRDGELICDLCHKPIVNSYDAILHHVTELDEINVHDAMISLNADNIQLLHHRCHNRVHERFGYTGTRHIYVVWGSPCAGKSAYVQANAGKADLIMDLDRLYDAIGVADNRAYVKDNVLDIRRMLLDQIKTRRGKWKTAWVVSTLPLTIDRDLMLRQLGGAELIHIDTSQEQCEAEALKRGGDWPEWTKKFWERYQK